MSGKWIFLLVWKHVSGVLVGIIKLEVGDGNVDAW